MENSVAGITLDSTLKAVVDAMGQGPYIDLAAMPLAEAIALARPDFPASQPPPGSVDRTVFGSGGAELRLRLYYPDAKDEDLPVVLYLHGGGFVGGTIEMDDTRCFRLACLGQCIVASLDYRLAPEYPFPTAIEDSIAVWNWIVANAGEIGGDGNRCAIYGSSAGGHIAVGMTLLARDRCSSMPGLLMLANPALDPNMDSCSYSEFKDGPFMTNSRMAWYWKQYGGDRCIGDSPLWNPMTANVTGLPATFIMTAEYDVLRDEGETFALRLRDAGVDAKAERYAGMIHGFMTVVPDHPTSVRAMRKSADRLRGALAETGS